VAIELLCPQQLSKHDTSTEGQPAVSNLAHQQGPLAVAGCPTVACLSMTYISGYARTVYMCMRLHTGHVYMVIDMDTWRSPWWWRSPQPTGTLLVNEKSRNIQVFNNTDIAIMATDAWPEWVRVDLSRWPSQKTSGTTLTCCSPDLLTVCPHARL
jgi:hypothetical protein